MGHRAFPSSAAQQGVDLDHRGVAGVDGVDDLGVVDALEVDRRDAEVAVTKLALDHDQRDAFACHLDGVGVSELVRSEAPAYRCAGSGAAQVARAAALAHRAPRVEPVTMQNSGPTGISSRTSSHG